MITRRFATLGRVLCFSVCGASARAAPDPGRRSRSIFPLGRKRVQSSIVVELSTFDRLACWHHGSVQRRSNDTERVRHRLSSALSTDEGATSRAVEGRRLVLLLSPGAAGA